MGGSGGSTGSFEQDLRAVIRDASEGMAAGDYERSARATGMIRTLTLVDPGGVPVPLFNLIIDDDRARFRLKGG